MYQFTINGYDVFKYPNFWWAYNGTKTRISNDYDTLISIL